MNVNSWIRTISEGRPPRQGRLLCALALSLGLAACGRNDVEVYRTAKEQPQQPQMAQANPGELPQGHPDVGRSAAAVPLKYTVPQGWEEVPAGEMRVASFRVKGDGGKQADVSVVPLPGMAGGDLANVNRWRSQVGLGPVDDAQLAQLAEPVEVAGQKASLFDQSGQNAGSGEKSRILAVVLHQDNTAWFFKMTGDDALVGQQKPSFVSFLKSVNFAPASAGSQPDLPPSHPPIDAGLLSAQAGAPAASAEGKPTWEVPAGWQPAAAGQFLVAKFTLPGSTGAPTAVNVSMSAGQGGGVAGNVNRWRGQLGLAPLGQDELEKSITSVDTSGGKAMFVDMSGTDPRTGQKVRLLGAIVPQTNQAWFYKMMGDEQVVGREKDAFTKFVQTAKYP